VPGPGAEKVRDPQHVGRLWRIIAAVIVVVLLVWRPLGLGAVVKPIRTDFVAMRHIQSAAGAAAARPMDRAKVAGMVDRAVQVAPENRVVTRYAGLLYMSAGSYEKAARHLSRLEERDLLTDANLGHCLLLSGQREAGTRLLSNVAAGVRAQRQLGAISAMEYAVYLNNIGYAYAAGDVELDQALAMSVEAVQIQPLQPAFIDSLGWAYYQSREYERAMFYLERAVRLGGEGNSAENYYHLGAAYARMGRIRPAAEALAKALRYDPQYQEAAAELRKLGYALPQPARA